jgi:hypothetical protein
MALDNKKIEEKPTKWEVIYEDEMEISIWRYNSKITTGGPVEVENRFKRGYKPPVEKKKKTLGDLAEEEKKKKKLNRPKS